MFHIYVYFLCSEHKENGKEHLVPGLKKKYSSLLYNLEQGRQDNKRWVTHCTYVSLTEFTVTIMASHSRIIKLVAATVVAIVIMMIMSLLLSQKFSAQYPSI